MADETRIPLLDGVRQDLSDSPQNQNDKDSAHIDMPAVYELDPRRRPGSILVRLIASAWFFTSVVLAFLFTISTQLAAWVLLFPVFLAKPAFRLKTQGLIFRFYQNAAAFHLNPFWWIKIVRPPPEIFNPHGRVLLMCNHSSGADAFVFSRATFPMEFKWVYKADLHKIPVAGLVLRLAGDLPVYFTKEKGGWGTKPGSVKALMERVFSMGVNHGIGTVVFPEGTRSATGRIQPFKDGFFRFACEHKWDILPAVAHNAQALWPLGSNLIGCGTCYVVFGNPITPKIGEAPEDLRDRVRNSMIELLALSPLYNPALDAPLEALAANRGRGL